MKLIINSSNYTYIDLYNRKIYNYIYLAFLKNSFYYESNDKIIFIIQITYIIIIII